MGSTSNFACLSQPIFSRSKFDPSLTGVVNNDKLTVNTGCLQVSENKERRDYCYGQPEEEEEGLKVNREMWHQPL
jgi:hypothetical protein